MNKIKTAFLRFKDLRNEINRDASYIVYASTNPCCENPDATPIGKRRAYFKAWYHHIHWMMLTTVCRYKGHEWVDDSSCGPDSGNMDHYCARCGYSVHHPLY